MTVKSLQASQRGSQPPLNLKVQVNSSRLHRRVEAPAKKKKTDINPIKLKNLVYENVAEETARLSDVRTSRDDEEDDHFKKYVQDVKNDALEAQEDAEK